MPIRTFALSFRFGR